MLASLSSSRRTYVSLRFPCDLPLWVWIEAGRAPETIEPTYDAHLRAKNRRHQTLGQAAE